MVDREWLSFFPQIHAWRAKSKIIMKMNNKKEERLELGEEKRQTTQRWVETATATEKRTNTIVKHRQKHSFLINTGNNRF